MTEKQTVRSTQLSDGIATYNNAILSAAVTNPKYTF